MAPRLKSNERLIYDIIRAIISNDRAVTEEAVARCAKTIALLIQPTRSE